MTDDPLCRCIGCGDLIAVEHNPKNCPGCDAPVSNHVPENADPWYSSEPTAFVLAAAVGLVLILLTVALSAIPVLGPMIAFFMIGGVIGAVVYTYRLLTDPSLPEKLGKRRLQKQRIAESRRRKETSDKPIRTNH